MTAALCAALVAGLATASGTAVATAAGSVLTIDGSYDFNGNGSTGVLTVSNAEGGSPAVTMAYRGLATEYDSGSWNAASGTLTVYRPLTGGAGQSYTLYLGGHNPASPVLGGYFTESDTGTRRFGAFADDYVPLNVTRPPAAPAPVNGTGSAVPVVTPGTSLPSGLPAYYSFDGNGWDGEFLMLPLNSGTSIGAYVQMYYNDLGTWQVLTNYSWNAATSTLTLVRPLSSGATQTYTLYLGTNDPANPMFGGYFTESDTPGAHYAAYAVYDPLAGHGG